VAHLNDGTLRRIVDDPDAITAPDREHYATCAECRARFDAMAEDARATSNLLDVSPQRPADVPNNPSAVNIVATATLAALVAWGGLGRFIVDGLGQQNYPMLYAGAILVGLLSLIVEFSLAGLQRLATPAGLRTSKIIRDPDSKTATNLAAA